MEAAFFIDNIPMLYINIQISYIDSCYNFDFISSSDSDCSSDLENTSDCGDIDEEDGGQSIHIKGSTKKVQKTPLNYARDYNVGGLITILCNHRYSLISVEVDRD